MKKILSSLLLVAYTTLSAQVIVTMEQEGGVYKVPCVVNGVKMKFIFDTGAAKVCISESMAEYLLDNDYLSKEDFIGVGTSMVADGRTVNNLQVILKDIEIGGLHLKNVEASVVEGQRAPLLLGQTAIQKIGKISIEGNKLTIDNGISDDVDIAIAILRNKAIYQGVLSEDVSFERFKKVLNDKVVLKDYFDYVKKEDPSFYNMNWETFIIEISKLLSFEPNKLVTKSEIEEEKKWMLYDNARQYEGNNQHVLAAEAWEEYYKPVGGIKKSVL